MRRALLAAAAVAIVVVGVALPAGAHPLGNFTVNQYSGIVVRPDRIAVDYVLDMAEIPSFQARPSIDTNGDGTLSPTEAASYARTTCTTVAARLTLTASDEPLTLAVTHSAASFPQGQAGLLTTRVTCALAAPFELSGDVRIRYQNANFADRVGWREITAAGDRTTISASNAPAATTSGRLTQYPKNALSSPPDQRTATFQVRAGGPALTTGTVSSARKPARGIDAATRAFTDYVGRTKLTVPVALLAFALAIVLGAIHAFAPGHGKTVMAAYLVGRQGSLRQASMIALTVTATHTGGVLLLGILISASAVIAPERLYPWLGALSGGLLFAIGVVMVRSRPPSSVALAVDTLTEPTAPPTRDLVGASVGAASTLPGQEHHTHHRHHDDHPHGPNREALTAQAAADDAHRHGGRRHTHTQAPPGAPLRPAGLLAMGFVGGLLPSPSALVVLLGAIALHRTWFGVVLVTAYGVGMALTLTGAGLLLVRGRVTIDRHLRIGRRLPALLAVERHLPALTGAVVIVVGTFLTAKGLLAIH